MIRFHNWNIDLYCKISIMKTGQIIREIRLKKGMTQEEDSSTQLTKYRQEGSMLLNGSKTPNVKQWLINRYFHVMKYSMSILSLSDTLL